MALARWGTLAGMLFSIPPHIGQPDNNLVGGTVAGAANTIAFNGTRGVVVVEGIGNAFLGNSIFANGGTNNVDLGIDLVGPADNASVRVTPNDAAMRMPAPTTCRISPC